MIVQRDHYGRMHYGAQRLSLGGAQRNLGFVELIVGAAGSILSAITGSYSVGPETERLKIESARAAAEEQARAAREIAVLREKTKTIMTYTVVGGAVLVAGALIVVGLRR